MNKTCTNKASCGNMDCVYYSKYTYTCDFLLLNGTRRGCPITCCDKYRPKTHKINDRNNGLYYPAFSVKKQGLTEEDKAKAMELYRKGYLDVEIGRLLKVPNMVVGAWRKRNGLPSNYYNYEGENANA